jgi:hypothetical protein
MGSNWGAIVAVCKGKRDGETERHALGILNLDVFRAPRVYFRHP